MMTNEVQTITATSGMRWCVDVVSSPEAYIAIGCWGLLTAFLAFHAVGAMLRAPSRSRVILASFPWLFTVLAIIAVAEGAQRTLATMLYTSLHPGTSSVGFWMDFPTWPSAASAALAAIGRLLVDRRRKNSPIGIGSPIAEAPSLPTGLTDRVSGGSAGKP